MKDKIDNILKENITEYIANIKKIGAKNKRYMSTDECCEIINDCYIKIIERFNNNKLDVKINLKHYFGQMTYNRFYDFVKEESKSKLSTLTLNINDESLINEDVDNNVDNEKDNLLLILNILEKLSEILTPLQFNIFIMKSINKKSCKKISLEMGINYRKVTNIFNKSQSIINKEFGENWKKNKYLK